MRVPALYRKAAMVAFMAAAVFLTPERAESATAAFSCVSGCCICDNSIFDCSNGTAAGDCLTYCGTSTVTSCDTFSSECPTFETFIECGV